jgi:hypothetical protein
LHDNGISSEYERSINGASSVAQKLANLSPVGHLQSRVAIFNKLFLKAAQASMAAQ